MSGVNDIRFRAPRATDAQRIGALVRADGVLEENSAYCYVLLCTHFAAHGLVAERRGELAGFVTAYRPPGDPETLFVWQIGVAAGARGLGLGGALLGQLILQSENRDARYLSATVAAGNEASNRLFAAFALRENAALEKREGFGAELFAPGHGAEPLLRIGPFDRRVPQNLSRKSA